MKRSGMHKNKRVWLACQPSRWWKSIHSPGKRE